MENNNKKEIINDKTSNSVKTQKISITIKKTDKNIRNSILSVTESNNLMLTEMYPNKNLEYEQYKNINELFAKYLKSPKNNIINILKTQKIRLSFLRIFEGREYNYESELTDNFDYYQSIVLYKECKYNQNVKQYKKCRLVIKENYLYLLNIYNNNKNIDFINPENSFLLKIEKDKKLDEQDKTNIKYKFDMTNPILCLNFNLITCIILINKMYLNEFTLLILAIFFYNRR